MNLASVISILRKETKRFKSPSVTQVADNSKDPFLILISCILSLRTKDKTTLSASARLFSLAKTPRQMRRLSLQQIEKAIYPVGFYRVKAKNILSICGDLVRKFNSKVPRKLNELLTLKGVGLKTANLVLGLGFGILAICVDTHVHRIVNRWGYVLTKTPEKTEAALRVRLPKKYWIEINDLLVMWGQNVCKPVRPLCNECTINKFCAKII